MSRYIVWDEGAAMVMVEDAHRLGAATRVTNKYCVDTACDKPTLRYGMYCALTSTPDNVRWMHIPLEEFPKEFLASLFLLGVT